MSIIYPVNRKEVADRVNTDIQKELPESDPFLRNSYLIALSIGYSSGIYDAYKIIQQLQKQLMPDTATDDFADRWASYKKIIRNAATQASGNVTATGIPATAIPINTTLQSSDGNQYITTVASSIQTQIISIISLTRSGGIVTATTSASHHFANGNYVLISGANQTEYNGSHYIVTTGLNTFTYEITTTPATPATGTIIATFSFASLPVKSIGYGLKTNLSSGSELFFTTQISGVDISTYVQFDGLTGGNDMESEEDFIKRYLFAYQNPISYWNDANIINMCKEIGGVTRVFVKDTTPDVGQVTIFFTCDNNPSPIPSGTLVAIVKEHLLLRKAAYVMPDDIIVKAPTAKVINFKFTVLDPNTDTMRAAITNSLQAFFSEIPIVGENLSKNSYASAIFSSVDTETGDVIKNFVLAYPIGDILVTSEELPILGTIQYPT